MSISHFVEGHKKYYHILKKIYTKYIKDTAKDVAKNINDKNLVILRSTVAIGTTRKIIDPILKKSKKNYYLSFCPERTLEGKALE